MTDFTFTNLSSAHGIFRTIDNFIADSIMKLPPLMPLHKSGLH